MIIGITGGSGCGKSTALKAIRDLGGMVLDCDIIYHRLLQPDETLLAAIGAAFPGTVTAGVLDRKKLASIVFSDEKSLETLNNITHSAVIREVKANLRPGLVAIEAIGLWESELKTLCDHTVCITAPEECRVARLTARDSITEAEALARIRGQKPQSYFSALCEFTLCNDGSEDAFYAQCLAFFEKWAIIEPKM